MELRELAELREDAAVLAGLLARVEWARASGRPIDFELRLVLREHRAATSRDGLSQVGEELERASSDEKAGRLARLSALREFLVRVRVLDLDPGTAQELWELPRRGAVRPSGDAGLHGALPEVQVERELPLVRSRDRRAELEQALAEAAREETGPRSAAWDASIEALGELQLGDPREASIALQARGWAADSGPAAAAEHLLIATQALASDLGRWLLERHTTAKAFPGDAERHDVLHFIHAPHFASAFPRGELLRTCRRWAEMLRLDLSALKLDEDERPLKPSGARVVALDPPDEVRVSLWPAEGPRALGELLGAISVAQLRRGPTDDVPPEDLWFGDAGVPHACAALLAGLVCDPLWLRRCAHADLSRDDERALAYASVLDARLAAARTLSSLHALESGFGARADEAHRELFARATGAAIPTALAARELSPFLDPWAELRGRSLAAHVRAFLRERFDEDWWRNPRALASLRALWGRGGRPTVPELWAELGGAPSTAPLEAWLAELCA